ncbi:MAG: protein translocase SEC61 complex subunit gamma [Candidatus Altiarchaeales archaeon WOR_SM1_79]|nr:MAG: protein translocase SEC61 complex subunit gamma [Candidatus Altiarchaeales archaeon WOR_SM1_79]
MKLNITEKSWELQEKIEERTKYIGRGKYGRVLKMARKPTSEEYSKTLQITGLGIILLGGIGFLIYLIWTTAPGFFSDLFGF